MPKLSSLASATKSAKPPSGKSISNKSVKPTRILSKLTVNDSDLESVTESSESGSSSEEEKVEEKKSSIIPKNSNRIKKSPSVSSSESDSDAESETGNGDDASSVKGDDESSDDELPQNPADARALQSKYVDMHGLEVDVSLTDTQQICNSSSKICEYCSIQHICTSIRIQSPGIV